MLEFLWNGAWQGSLVVLVVAIAARLWRGQSSRSKAWMWWLASAKFLAIALLFVAPLSLPLLRDTPIEFVKRSKTVHLASAVPAMRSSTASVSSPSTLDSSKILLFCWAVGFVAILVVGFAGTLKIYRELRRSTRLEEDFNGVALYGSARVSSPMTIRPWNPVILVPEGWVASWSANEREMALRHEFAHIQNRDLLWGLVPDIATLVFFFLPTVWWARKEWIAAREEACDAEAIAACGVTPRQYGELLLKVAGGSTPALGTAAFDSQLKQRIKMLKKNELQKPLRFVAVLAVASAFVLVLPWQVVAKGIQSAMSVDEAKIKTKSNLKTLGLASLMYSEDYDNLYPNGATSDKCFSLMGPYMKDPAKSTKSYNPAGGSLKFNTALAGVNQSKLANKDTTVVAYDPKAWPNDTHLAALVDGHASEFSSSEWKKVKSSLTKSYNKVSKIQP